jgi:hypothetical protein
VVVRSGVDIYGPNRAADLFVVPIADAAESMYLHGNAS